MVFISCFISTVILTKMNILYYDYPIFAVNTNWRYIDQTTQQFYNSLMHVWLLTEKYGSWKTAVFQCIISEKPNAHIFLQHANKIYRFLCRM